MAKKEEIMQDAEAMRAELHAKRNKKVVEPNHREEFKAFFAKAKKELKLASDLEDIIWLHFKACGFDVKEKFDAGMKHFGYNK